jgi:hypothetical protein
MAIKPISPVGSGGVAGVSTFNGRSGAVSPLESDYSGFYEKNFAAIVEIESAADVVGPFQSDVLYRIVVATLNMTGSGNSFEVPPNGLNLIGLSNNLTTITCSDDNYTLFESPVANSGNFFFSDFQIQITGNNSQVYDLTDATGFSAIEYRNINYLSCTSLGTINGYRQILARNVARFGGTPELTIEGITGGLREDTSIVAGTSNITSIYRAGPSLSITGRFIVNMNCNLPTVGALCDFSEINIVNDESLIFDNCYIRRNSSIVTSDPDITPNISHTSVKSSWSDNTGIPNTVKYFETRVTAEAETVISLADTYYPINGTFSLDKSVHFDMPVGGVYRLLTGNGTYRFTGSLTINGSADDILDVRIVRSSDGGTTWPDVINHLRRPVNNVLGVSNDVAFFDISFIDTLEKDDRIRIEVENVGDTNNVTVRNDSYINVSSA